MVSLTLKDFYFSFKIINNKLFYRILLYKPCKNHQMEVEYTCPACNKTIDQYSIKMHINNCRKYDSFFLTKIKKLDESNNVN